MLATTATALYVGRCLGRQVAEFLHEKFPQADGSKTFGGQDGVRAACQGDEEVVEKVIYLLLCARESLGLGKQRDNIRYDYSDQRFGERLCTSQT